MSVYVLFDTETTGLTLPSTVPLERQPYVIEFGALKYNVSNGKISKLSEFIKPPIPIPSEASKINGIFDADVVNAKSFPKFLPKLHRFFAGVDYCVAHNAEFDLAVVNHELARCCKSFTWPTVRCSMNEFMHLFGYRPSLKLLYYHFTGKELRQTHRALDDVEALYKALQLAEFFK